jgi:hypothetical protein
MKPFFTIRAALVYLVLIWSFSSCTSTVSSGPPQYGPPPHAKAHGYRRRHTYRYYPSSYVYFDCTRKVYFYLEGSVWRMSASLPASIRIDLKEAVSLEMDTDKPYVHFGAHKKKYPPGQAKKGAGKGKGKGRGKDKWK